MIQFDKPLLWLEPQTKDLFLEKYHLICDHKIVAGISEFLEQSFTPAIMGICITYALTAIAIFFAFVIIKYQPLFQYYGETVANWYLQEMKPVHYLKSGLLSIGVLFVSYMVYTGVGDEHGIISLIMFCIFIIVLVLFTLFFVDRITWVLKDNYLETNISKLYRSINRENLNQYKNEKKPTDELERLIKTSIENNNIPMIEKLLEGYKSLIETKLSDEQDLTAEERLLYMFLNNINKSNESHKLTQILANFIVTLLEVHLKHQDTNCVWVLSDFSLLIKKSKEINVSLIPYRQAVDIFSLIFLHCNQNPANDGKYLMLKHYFDTAIDGILAHGNKEDKRNFFRGIFHEFTETKRKNEKADTNNEQTGNETNTSSLYSEFENFLYEDTLIEKEESNRLLEIIRCGYWDVLEDLGSFEERIEQIKQLNRFIQHIGDNKKTINTEEYCNVLHPIIMDVFIRFHDFSISFDLFETGTFKLILEHYIKKNSFAKAAILNTRDYELILDYLKIEL